jgi:hypothetical protein
MASVDRPIRGLRPYLLNIKNVRKPREVPERSFVREYAGQAEEARKANAAGKSDYSRSTDDNG